MEEALLVLLGTAGTVIVGLLGLVAVMMRRNGKNHNPSLATVDEKLNQILLVLTEMKAVIEHCPIPRDRS